MLTYKEFEVVRALLSGQHDSAALAEQIYAGARYTVFKSAEEVNMLLDSLVSKNICKKKRNCIISGIS
jgi:hypothetical protein